MTKIEVLRHSLINKILVTDNENLLEAIFGMFESTRPENEAHFSPSQIEMLRISEDDIKNKRIVSEEELRISDNEWLS